MVRPLLRGLLLCYAGVRKKSMILHHFTTGVSVLERMGMSSGRTCDPDAALYVDEQVVMCERLL